jgi:prevent-host-death family protein
VTARTAPAEVTATELQRDYARVIRDAEYGHPTTVTRSGKAVAKVVHPDAIVAPAPELWQAAQEAYDALSACHLSPDSHNILSILGMLLASYYDNEEETS